MTQTERPLQAARVALGWSQSRAAEELAALAAARGTMVAAPASLKTQLSRWENRHALPDEHYRALLRELYQSTDAELGLVEPAVSVEPLASDADELRARLASSSAIDDAAIELIRAQLRSTRALDDRLGAAAASGAARAQLSYLEEALRHATSARTRQRLAGLVVDAASLSGRLALDADRPTEAWRCHETAKAAAREAESPALLGYAMVEQSTVLIEIGVPATAVGLVEQARALAIDEASRPLRALLDASLGYAKASAGERREAHDAYREAERELTRHHGDITFPELSLPEFDVVALRRHRGHALRVLHENESAIEELGSALRTGAGPARELARLHLDLAWAHREIGHHVEANTHARAAREIATRIGSRRLALLLDTTPADADAEISRS
jgi:transcriptional regulator with XRE-family HTH domain